MDKEWMPVKEPICGYCNFQMTGCACGENTELGCPYLQGAKDWQLKLLEHIDRKYRCGIKEDMACGYIMIPPEEFQQMKSQLEKER
ncbi:MAG: hypothetical protein PHI12_08750 [Dehalococcoidales bacterium]|nr:hypothetical protein [Dehalococcoidales bacterium]